MAQSDRPLFCSLAEETAKLSFNHSGRKYQYWVLIHMLIKTVFCSDFKGLPWH